MTTSPQLFFWYELMTTDVKSAATFYKAVVGWDVQGPDQTGMDYTVFQVGDRGVAGLTNQPQEVLATGAEPSWIGYILVDDVDAWVTRVIEAGGAERSAPTDIPDVGRFAMVNDAQGAPFMLMKPQGPDRSAADPTLPGMVVWHELMAIDGPAALEFYSGLFGWSKSISYDMGPMGTYQLFSEGGPDVGGMMTKPPHIPWPYWLFYFQVDGVRAATERVKAAGGTVTNGPHQVPSGNWVVQGRDPQGAMFALTSFTA